MLGFLLHGKVVAQFHMSHFGGTGIQELKRRVSSHNSGIYKASNNFKKAGRNMCPRKDMCLFCCHGHWEITSTSRSQGTAHYVDVVVRCAEDCANR